MKMCTEHWAKLRKAIDDRGLGHLVAKSREAAMETIVRMVEGDGDPKRDFDPLMEANWAIFSAALHDGGLALLAKECCPLCVCEESKTGLADNWIEGASDDQLERARQLGLTAAVQ
jgi:hypothetical protein